MANQKVTLYIRIIHEGKRIQCKPVYADKNQSRLKPLYAEGHGHHPEAEYYLRYAGVWEAVGDDPYVALDRLHERKEELRRGARSSPAAVTVAESVREVPGSRVTVEAAIKDYLTTGKAAEKDWRQHTLQCYTLALKLFRQSCKKTFLDEISGGDLRTFKVLLRAQKTSTGRKVDPRTVYNHFNNTVSFLNTYGRRDLIPRNEWPAYEEKKVVAYDPEVMQHLLQFATVDEADVLEFFLGVNFRNGEGAHVEWPDINLRTKEVKVYSKREKFDWQVKDSEQRHIAINDTLAERLAARYKRYAGNGLVFPNSKGNPDTHLLRIIKSVALRAGLNCGQCTGTHQRKRMSCAVAPVCRKWIIHTLRKTWATFQARIGTDFATIQTELGHSSPVTTQKYLASQDHNSPRRREQINAAAALVSRNSDEQASIQ
jgi:integrase